MQNFLNTFETHEQPFISAFSICMTPYIMAVQMLEPGNGTKISDEK